MNAKFINFYWEQSTVNSFFLLLLFFTRKMQKQSVDQISIQNTEKKKKKIQYLILDASCGPFNMNCWNVTDIKTPPPKKQKH